jgi:signal transduction histidine kinase/DNA-binding response OmpR family regulator
VFFERMHPDDRPSVRELFLQQLRDRLVKNGELRHEALQYRVLRRDGSFVWVHADAISLRGADGRTLRYICSILDITEHRAVAERLRRQNAALAENARLREDVERMSRHDLKTPLNSIIGVARLLLDDPHVQPEHRELLTIAERAGYRMLEMVNLSLDLSRMERGNYDFRPQAVNLVDVVARVAQDLASHAQAARVQVRHDHAFEGPVYARAEELLCYSILANLLKNAIEATPPGGTVRIGIDAGEPVRLWVRNPGRVPEAFRKRFFDKYATLGKSGGTGLGTYSARLMARVQQGELDMASGVDGTLVTLTLRPLGAEQLPAPRQPVPQGLPARLLASDFGPRRVLVVDDDEYNRLLLLRYLPSPPFTVETAANGEAATDAVARQWPDIVLIDMEMPVMNGLEAVAWIRARERREGRAPCLVLMLSSNDDPLSIRRGLAAGSNRYLTKPFTREALLAALHALDSGGGVPTQVPLELEAPAAAAAETAAPADATAPVQVDGELRAEVPAFLESRRQLVEGMRQALASGNREQLRAVAHRAAGGLALFGFQWAAWQSRRISQRAAEGDNAWLADEIARLREHLQQVQVR